MHQVARSSEPWWKKQEELVLLFEQTARPVSSSVRRAVFQQDIVGIARQLDVAVFDSGVNTNLKSFVEVQKRRKKVGIADFGSFIYKRNTLGVEELGIVSEVGFTRAVVTHVKKLYSSGVFLGVLHPVPDGALPDLGSTMEGLVRVEGKWFFAAVVIGYKDGAGSDTIFGAELGAGDRPVFGDTTPMHLINHLIQEQGPQKDGIHTVRVTMDGDVRRNDRIISDIVMVAELRTKVWDVKSEFYSYEEVYPKPHQRGLAHLSESMFGNEQILEATLIMIPIRDGPSGPDCKIAGQFFIRDRMPKR